MLTEGWYAASSPGYGQLMTFDITASSDQSKGLMAATFDTLWVMYSVRRPPTDEQTPESGRYISFTPPLAVTWGRQSNRAELVDLQDGRIRASPVSHPWSVRLNAVTSAPCSWVTNWW